MLRHWSPKCSHGTNARKYFHQTKGLILSALFQEMCKLLQIKLINSTTFKPKIQGNVEGFHAGLNQTMSHYVNKYATDWDDFVDYALMVHRATPHSNKV